MAATKDDSTLEISPLRTLDDFLLESARFQVPNFQDLEKWGNRVYNNLIYYQTNYFLMSVALFILVGFIHPLKMALGLMAVGVTFSLFALAGQAGAEVANFKRDHPVISLCAILVGGYLIVYLFDGIVIFMLGVLLPFSAIFIHASLRLRNIRNKLANKMEQIGLKKLTPMAVILNALGFECDIIN